MLKSLKKEILKFAKSPNFRKKSEKLLKKSRRNVKISEKGDPKICQKS